jgi:hypothetical protein
VCLLLGAEVEELHAANIEGHRCFGKGDERRFGEGQGVMRTATIVLLSLLAIGWGAAYAATGQRAGCMVADIELRRPVTLYLSTTSYTWSVRGNTRFVVLDTMGQAFTVDEDTETWVIDRDGASVHSRKPLRDDAPAAQWKGSKILDGLPKDSCPQGVGWLVLYK